MSAYQLQIAVYNYLSADLDLMALIRGIYDNPQQIKKPESSAEFPFLTIGDDSLKPWDTDTEVGFDCEITIHTWSMASNWLECKQIQDAVYTALHRNEFSRSGFDFVGCDLVTQDAQRDQDGITIHGIQTFKIIFERV